MKTPFIIPLLMCCTLSFSSPVETQLSRYKDYLEKGTYDGADWSRFTVLPKSRYHTFLFAFEHFAQHNGKTVVELGTSRSFTHGGHIGCNQDDPKYWMPNQPEFWDWGAGFFTRMAAESLRYLNPIIHTVDLASSHIQRCKVMTADLSSIIRYHVSSSLDYLKKCAPHSIDLLYVDTGDMTPIEPTARLQLEEVKIIVERDLLTSHGLILIDDVKNQTPWKFGDTSGLGKSKYALPFLLNHGYEIVADEYQVILQKKTR